jgi:hypothetical protein
VRRLRGGSPAGLVLRRRRRPAWQRYGVVSCPQTVQRDGQEAVSNACLAVGGLIGPAPAELLDQEGDVQRRDVIAQVA